LINTDLTSESSVGLVKNILCGDLDALSGMFTGEEEIEGWGSDNDL
jgi:hypothetical protein